MRVGNIHEPQRRVDVTKIPAERQTQSLRRNGDTISLPRFSHVDDGGRDEEETPGNTTTSASVNDTFELHDPDCALEGDKAEHHSQDFNEHEERSRDADSNPFVRRSPRRQSRRRAGTMGRLHSESNVQSRRLVGRRRNHVVDPQTQQDFLEAGKIDCQTPQRSLNKVHLQLESSDINRAERVPEARKTGQEMEIRLQHVLITNQKHTGGQNSCPTGTW